MVLFLVGANNNDDWSLVKPNIEEHTCLCFTLRNSAGISGLFILNMQTLAIFTTCEGIIFVDTSLCSVHVTEHMIDSSKALLVLRYSISLISVYLHVPLTNV